MGADETRDNEAGGSLNKLPVWIALATSLAWVSVGQVPQRSLFLYLDGQTQQWCVYHSEDAFTAAREKVEEYQAAVIQYEGERPVSVGVTEWNESGDWAVYDDYSLTDMGELSELTRYYDQHMGGFTEKTIYGIVAGESQVKTQAFLDLETQEPLAGNPGARVETIVTDGKAERWLDYFPIHIIPVVTRVTDFPFKSILRGEHPEVWEREPVCVGK